MSEITVMNSSLPVERTPLLIAVEINSIKDQTRKLVLYNSIEIGRRLVEAKAMIPHGEWGNWLKKSVDYSQSTANNLMRIFEEYGANQIAIFGDNAKYQALGNLSYTQAVALLGIPADEREQFIKEHDVENMSSRELQKLIKERDNAKKLVNELVEERDKLRSETSSLQSNVATANQLLKDKNDTIKMLQEELEKERQRTKSEVERLSGLLKEARSDGSSDEMVKQLEKQLKEAQRKVEELTEKMKQPVTVEAAVVEKIPEDVEKELAELRQKVSQAGDKAVIKFSLCFEALVKGFNDLLGALGEISDPNTQAKYKGAVSGLIGKMSERL